MKRTCVACGAAGPLERHHVTGRAGPGLAYLDPAFTVELCKGCHDREHVALRRAGLAWPEGPVLAHRLRRTANLLSRLVDAGWLPAWTAPLSNLLAEAADAAHNIPREAAS